jgi:hypothetical protein
MKSYDIDSDDAMERWDHSRISVGLGHGCHSMRNTYALVGNTSRNHTRLGIGG